MRKADLKDGMMVTYRCGGKRLVLGESLYEDIGNGRIEYVANIGENFNSKLESKNKDEYDIMKVSYMGEVLWERKEYMTFIEAAKSGKKFKHKDCGGYWWSASIVLDYYEKLVEEKSGEEFEGKQAFKHVAEEMEKKVWEVEQ